MKRYITTTAILLISMTLLAQQRHEGPSVYGVSVSNTATGSGTGLSSDLNVFVIKGKNQLQAGALMNYERGKIAGEQVLFKHYFTSDTYYNKNYRSGRSRVEPYLMYNLIYRSTTSTDNFHYTKSGSIGGTQSPDDVISSIEHYLGAGAKVLITNNLFLDGNMGAGIYLGTINKADRKLDFLAINKDNKGYGLAFKLGIGYEF